MNQFKITAGYGRIYVGGPDATAVASSMNGAAWNPRKRSWELSLTIDSLRGLRAHTGLSRADFASRCDGQVLQWVRAAGAMEAQVLATHARISSGYRTDLPWFDATGQDRAPFEHQKVMATAACEIDGVAFLAEMGTGKTRAATEAMRYRVEHHHVDVVVVLCPKIVQSVWARELPDWTTGLTPLVLSGPVKDRKRALEGVSRRGTVVILNYDGAIRMADALMELADRMKVGLVLDEGHRTRNPTTKTSKVVTKLARKCGWRLLMTGTPIIQGVQDIWAQWYSVDLGVTFGANNAQFKREYLIENPYNFGVSPQPGALDRANQRIHLRGLRYRKADCLDLPPKVYERLDVEMTPLQRRAYITMRDELVAWLDSDEQATAATRLSALLRLSQITSGFLPTDGENGEPGPVHDFSPNPKMVALMDILEDATDQSVIVWAWYRRDVERIVSACRGLNPVYIMGGVSDEARAAAVDMFQSGETKLIVANPASAGMGITLSKASLAIYYSQGYSLEHRLQSEDRSHRSGSEIHDSVTYIDLTCTGTIDEVVRAALVQKLSVAEAVVELRSHLQSLT